jgi:hypothetical protein
MYHTILYIKIEKNKGLKGLILKGLILKKALKQDKDILSQHTMSGFKTSGFTAEQAIALVKDRRRFWTIVEEMRASGKTMDELSENCESVRVRRDELLENCESVRIRRDEFLPADLVKKMDSK